MPLSQKYRVGVDIGGTFTDLIVVDDHSGAFWLGKALTTTDDPSRAVETVLAETLAQAGIAASEIQRIVHGTTLVTNALIERKGARTALLTTAGFRDSIEIGRENRFELYDLMLENPRPLVPRYLRFDVPQRTLADGTTLRELDEGYVEHLAKELAANGIEAVESSATYQPDVVVMDINLPGLNGIDATRRVKKEAPNSVVIGLSVHYSSQTEAALTEAGASALLSKEQATEDLYRTIIRFLKDPVIP